MKRGWAFFNKNIEISKPSCLVSAGLASDVGSGLFCIFPHRGEAVKAGGGGRGIKEML